MLTRKEQYIALAIIFVPPITVVLLIALYLYLTR